MDAKFLDTRYAQLCAQLGDLMCNLERLQSKIQELKVEISGLDKMKALFKQKEAADEFMQTFVKQERKDGRAADKHSTCSATVHDKQSNIAGQDGQDNT